MFADGFAQFLFLFRRQSRRHIFAPKPSHHFGALCFGQLEEGFKHLFFRENGPDNRLNSSTVQRKAQRRARRGRGRVRAEQSEEAPQKTSRHKTNSPPNAVVM